MAIRGSLQVAEQHLERLLAAGPAVLYVCRVDGDEILPAWISDNVTRLLGYETDECIDNPDWWVSHVHPEDRDGIFAKVPRLFSTGRIEIEYRFQHKNGNYLWIHDELKVVTDASGIATEIVGAWVDITERRRAEAALHDSEARLNAFFTDAPAGLAILDTELRIAKINPPLARANVLPVEDHIGKTLHEVAPELALELEPMLRQILKSGEPMLNIEIQGVAPFDPGQEPWWSFSAFPIAMTTGEPFGTGAIVVEITERKRAEKNLRRLNDELELRIDERTAELRQSILDLEREVDQRERAEQALRDSQARLQLLAANIPGCVYQRLVKTDGSIHYPFVSEGIRDIFGHEPEDIMASPSRFQEAIHPDDREAFMTSLRESAETLDTRDAEFRVVRQDGETKWLHCRSRPRRLENGDIIWDSNLVDVTERKDVEERLRQCQKLESIGRLTTGIAHEFNNHLTSILNALQLIEDNIGDDEDLHKFIDAAQRSAWREAEMIASLLSFARAQPLRPRAIDVNGVIAGLLAALRGTLGPAIEIKTVLRDDLWRATADRGQLENALLNLALNARDAMPEGGELTIETANAHIGEQAVAAHPGMKPGEFVKVIVIDTGSGIDASDLEHVFEPFFTTKDAGKGTGLGLSRVHGFAAQSNGFITIDSRIGHGTRLELYLPRILVET